MVKQTLLRFFKLKEILDANATEVSLRDKLSWLPMTLPRP